MEEAAEVYRAALEALERGEPAALATVIAARVPSPRRPGAKMLIYADGRTVGSVGGGSVEARAIEAARQALAAGEPRELDCPPDEAACCAGVRLFIEPLLARPTLLIVGAGHVGQAVAELGAFLGFRVAVADERAELLTRDRFPQAERLLPGPPAQSLGEFAFTPTTYVVLLTPHQSLDEELLALLAERPTAYVGLLGSQRRSQATFERARARGVPEAWLAQVRTPVGLAIGAETPREIAVSILAEIIAVQRGPSRPGCARPA